MKALSRIVILSLLLATALPLALAWAQEDVVVPEDLSGFYTLSAESGSFADNGDETYTLTLEAVAENVNWVADAPKLSAGFYQILHLARNWAAVPEGLEGTAVLAFEDLTLQLALTAPEFDLELGTVTFTASITDFTGEMPKGGPPEAFEAPTLFILLDYDFQMGLVAGFDASVGQTRESCAFPGCR